MMNFVSQRALMKNWWYLANDKDVPVWYDFMHRNHVCRIINRNKSDDEIVKSFTTQDNLKAYSE
jgi:hypothetical protein